MTSHSIAPSADAAQISIKVRRQTLSGIIALSLFVFALVALAAMPWWAKTGTIRGVSALSGYVDRRDGRRIAFSILMNWDRLPDIDRIIVTVTSDARVVLREAIAAVAAARMKR